MTNWRRHLKGLSLAALLLGALFVLVPRELLYPFTRQAHYDRAMAPERDRLAHAAEGLERELLETTNLVVEARAKSSSNGEHDVTVEYLALPPELDRKQLYWIAERAVNNRFAKVRDFRIHGIPFPGPMPRGTVLNARHTTRQTAEDGRKAHEGHDHSRRTHTIEDD